MLSKFGKRGTMGGTKQIYCVNQVLCPHAKNVKKNMIFHLVCNYIKERHRQ